MHRLVTMKHIFVAMALEFMFEKCMTSKPCLKTTANKNPNTFLHIFKQINFYFSAQWLFEY